MPLLLLFVVFIVVPIAELYVLIQVGEAIGVLPTIALLLLDSILGTALMKAQGRTAWRRFNEAVAAGRVPAKETFDGALVILGGAFLITPGFITDVFGALFLLPPTRALVRGAMWRAFRARVRVAAPGGPRMGGFGFGGPDRRSGGYPTRGSGADVEGTATEVDDDPPQLP